uniref:Uncharacterized protein n=1 Tax=Arundo donax TaxID=35708 RepID=A0A0A9BBR4_ARUDO
MGTQRLRNMSR